MDKNEELKKIADYYDNRAKKLDEVRAAGQWGSKELAPLIVDEICKKIKIEKQDNVLEIGSGSGILGNTIKKKCNLYVGTDISIEMLKKFRDVSETKLSLFQCITNILPFPDKFFDVVIMNSVTMYFNQNNQLEKTLIEIERISKENAIIFIGDNIVPSESHWEYTWFKKLNSVEQKLMKPYIRIRKGLAQKNSKLAGKWKKSYAEVSPKFIKKYFGNRAKVIKTASSASFIKNKQANNKNSRRVDFVIKLEKSSKIS